MPGSALPTQRQLIESCHSVEGVLDALRNHPNRPFYTPSGILSSVKALFNSLQRLESDESKVDGAFYTADIQARRNLADVLTSCGIVAGQLRARLDSNALRNENSLRIGLTSLTNEVEDFLKLRKKVAATPARPKPGTAAESFTLVEDLLRKQQEHQSETEGLEREITTLYDRERTFEQEIETLGAKIAAKDRFIHELRNHNDSKLYHIRRLHAAVSNLGLRHPMTHPTYDWDDLTDELPAMIQRIENVNSKLKELELARDRLEDQEHESEGDMVAGGLASAPKPPSAVNTSELPTRQKDKSKDKDKDAKKKSKDHRRPVDAKPYTKARSPSPASSEVSKANTSNSAWTRSRRRS